MIKKRYLWLLAFALLFLDQITKYWARHVLREVDKISVIKGVFSFSYVENRGAVWGVLQGKYMALAIMTVFITLALIYFIYKIPQDRKYNYLQLTMVLLTSGAVGNLFDRLYFRYVTDFLYFELIDFPVFNVADCYVTVSAFLLILLFCFYYKEKDLEFFPFMDLKWFHKDRDEKEEEKEKSEEKKEPEEKET